MILAPVAAVRNTNIVMEKDCKSPVSSSPQMGEEDQVFY